MQSIKIDQDSTNYSFYKECFDHFKQQWDDWKKGFQCSSPIVEQQHDEINSQNLKRIEQYNSLPILFELYFDFIKRGNSIGIPIECIDNGFKKMIAEHSTYSWQQISLMKFDEM